MSFPLYRSVDDIPNYKAVVDLSINGELGLIIQCQTNVLFHFISGGDAYMDSFAEGIFIPLRDEHCDNFGMMIKHFQAAYGERSYSINSETADYFDEAFRKCASGSPGIPSTNFLTVDRRRLNESCEGWIYVNITSQTKAFSGQMDPANIYMYNFPENWTSGILVW